MKNRRCVSPSWNFTTELALISWLKNCELKQTKCSWRTLFAKKEKRNKMKISVRVFPVLEKIDSGNCINASLYRRGKRKSDLIIFSEAALGGLNITGIYTQDSQNCLCNGFFWSKILQQKSNTILHRNRFWLFGKRKGLYLWQLCLVWQIWSDCRSLSQNIQGLATFRSYLKRLCLRKYLGLQILFTVKSEF